MKVICVGELMVEMANTQGNIYKKTYAGDTFNTAYYMRAYAPSTWDIHYGTKLGKNTDDKGAVQFIEQFGIGTDYIAYSDTKTIGLFTLGNDENGEKQYGYWRGMSAAKYYFDDVRCFSDFDLVYISGITAAITHNRDNLVQSIKMTKQRTLEQGKKVIIAYDFNHRRQLWQPSQAKLFAENLMPYCDILKISDEELPWIFGADMTLAQLFEHAPHSEVIFTKGAGGSERWINGAMDMRIPAVHVDTVVDTSAAGDSFIALYLTGCLNGKDRIKSLKNASQVASAVLGVKGSIAPIDTLPSLDW